MEKMKMSSIHTLLQNVHQFIMQKKKTTQTQNSDPWKASIFTVRHSHFASRSGSRPGVCFQKPWMIWELR